MLEIVNINKSFGSFRVLREVSLEINEGKVFCLLGPNGSGKTTIVNCILSLLNYSGEIKIGNKMQYSRKNIGIILEEEGFFRDISIFKNLVISSLVRESPVDNIDPLLKMVGLDRFKKRKVRKLSSGMKKRLAIADSLIGDPELLIWDEPFNSLDPEGFIFIRDLIARLTQKGKTIVLCTHLLDEVEKVAEEVGLLYNGELLAQMTLKEILEKHESVESFYFHYIQDEKY